MFLHACDHVGKIILCVGMLAIRVDTHESDPLGSKPVDRLPSDLIRANDIRTVVTRKKDHQYPRIGKI